MSRPMKDSGIEWIGEIPENWIHLSLLKALRESITDGPHETPEYLDEGIPFVSVDSLGSGEHIDFTCIKKFISKEDYVKYSKKTKLEDGDILFTKSATIGKTAIVDTKIEYMIWSPLALLKPNSQVILSKLMYYILNSHKYIEHVMLMGTANTQVNVGMRTLEKSKIPVPDDNAYQLRIVDYLDSKIAEIDNILSKTRESIEEYKKYKQSLITETVTKGLNSNVKMKDSGVEWIGEIPEPWECTSVSRIATVVRGASPRPAGDPQYFNGNDVPWITVAEVTKGESKYILETETYLTLEGSKRSRIVEEGTLLLSNSGATLGVPKITKIRGCINDGSVAFYDLNISQMYFYYVLKSRTYELRKQMQGYGQPNLNTTIVKAIEVPLPPKHDQDMICMYLDEKLSFIDDLIDQKNRIISELESYKKSLIYEVVTGKKEV